METSAFKFENKMLSVMPSITGHVVDSMAPNVLDCMVVEFGKPHKPRTRAASVPPSPDWTNDKTKQMFSAQSELGPVLILPSHMGTLACAGGAGATCVHPPTSFVHEI